MAGNQRRIVSAFFHSADAFIETACGIYLLAGANSSRILQIHLFV